MTAGADALNRAVRRANAKALKTKDSRPKHVRDIEQQLKAAQRSESRPSTPSAPTASAGRRSSRAPYYAAGGAAAAGAGVGLVALRRRKGSWQDKARADNDRKAAADPSYARREEQAAARFRKPGEPAMKWGQGGLQPVKKNLVAVTVAKAAYSQDGGRPTTLTARTPSGRFVSHENDLDVFHVKPRRKVTSQLGVYRKGRGSSKAWVAKASWMTPEAIAAVKAKPAARPTLKFGWRGEPVMPHTGKFGWRGEPTRAAGFGVSKAALPSRALPGKLEAYGRGPGRRIV